jgi:hydroxyethylthiazole kinase-like uncharacterized protein yjeF
MMGKTRANEKENAPSHWRLPPLHTDDHKYRRGHVALLGGGKMTGAAKLAAIAALRIGAGVVTLAATAEAWPIYAAALASVITRKLTEKEDWRWILQNRKVNTVLLGPGAEPDGLLRDAFIATAERALPMVLDAGALTLLAEEPVLRGHLKGQRFVCLPHEGEYRRLAKAFGLDDAATREMRAQALAEALGGVVVLKGSQSIIADVAGKLRINSNAPPWLATAGSGDVLAGMVAGLLAQGMTPFDAACAGVWLHGGAADRLGRGMIAEDLLEEIAPVLRALES